MFTTYIQVRNVPVRREFTPPISINLSLTLSAMYKASVTPSINRSFDSVIKRDRPPRRRSFPLKRSFKHSGWDYKLPRDSRRRKFSDKQQKSEIFLCKQINFRLDGMFVQQLHVTKGRGDVTSSKGEVRAAAWLMDSKDPVGGRGLRLEDQSASGRNVND